ncbi:MAG: putative endonuclease [Clostridiales bacterium]|nr:putative endonuclease [Clostridiales bacterium]MDK2933275.1 putative endonuclease [Clostridiales bacterium]
MYYVYIVECKDGTLYTGWTTNLQRRIHEHNRGKGAKYTRSRYPVELKYFEKFTTKQEAMKREYAIKRLAKKEKVKLLNGRE